MAFQVTLTTLPMPYPVWVFVLGPSSGPRRMLVRREADGYVGIKADEKIFTPDADIKVTIITIDNKIYHIYFDKNIHHANRRNAKYIFMRCRACSTAERAATNIVLAPIARTSCCSSAPYARAPHSSRSCSPLLTRTPCSLCSCSLLLTLLLLALVLPSLIAPF